MRRRLRHRGSAAALCRFYCCFPVAFLLCYLFIRVPAAVEDDLSHHDFVFAWLYFLSSSSTPLIFVKTLRARRNRLLHHHHHHSALRVFSLCRLWVVVVGFGAYPRPPPALFHAFMRTFLGFLGRVRRAALLLFVLPLPMPLFLLRPSPFFFSSRALSS